VHAWSFYGEQLLRSRVAADEVDQYVANARHTSAEALQRLLRPFGASIDPSHVHLQRGDASEVIGRMASTLPADVLVMGTVARTGIPGLLMGNTAETVLPSITCDVLVVKPQGFVSPLSRPEEHAAADDRASVSRSA
jgi:nucleotide-binding universal stress UspA family protein